MFRRVLFRSTDGDWRRVAAVVLRTYLLASAAAGVALWAGAGVLARFLRELALPRYLRLLAADVVLSCLAQCHRDVLVGVGRFTPRAVATAARRLVRLGLVVGLVWGGVGMSGALLASLCASVADLVVGAVALWMWKVSDTGVRLVPTFGLREL